MPDLETVKEDLIEFCRKHKVILSAAEEDPLIEIIETETGRSLFTFSSVHSETGFSH